MICRKSHLPAFVRPLLHSDMLFILHLIGLMGVLPIFALCGKAIFLRRFFI